MTIYPKNELADLDDRTPRHKRVTVTSAEILAMNTTPVVLLASPGAGKANIIERVVVRNQFLTGAYAFTTIANISYTDESGAPIVAFVALFLETVATAVLWYGSRAFQARFLSQKKLEASSTLAVASDRGAPGSFFLSALMFWM